MTSITPKEAHDYLDRWKLVRELEADELRNASLETKLQQLAVLMGSRGLFSNDVHRDERVREVRDRWASIRRAFYD